MIIGKSQDPTKLYLSRPLFTRPRSVAMKAGHVAKGGVDVLLINPPLPEKNGRWAGEIADDSHSQATEMGWLHVSLAQLAAMLTPDYNVAVIDAVAQKLTWSAVETLLRTMQPRYYVTHVRAATLQNDLLGVLMARSVGADTVAFGHYATATAQHVSEQYPTLDFALRGEPELPLRELIDTLESAAFRWNEAKAEPLAWAKLQSLFKATQPDWQPAWQTGDTLEEQLAHIQGLVWRRQGRTRLNPKRPPLPNLDDLPLAHHHLSPVKQYRRSPHKSAQAFVIANRSEPTADGHPASVRYRTPESIVTELWLLHDSGVRQAHFLGDVFTANREPVLRLCKMMIEEDLPLRWSCTTTIAAVDEELLTLMGRAGCQKIFWHVESVTAQAHNETPATYGSLQAPQALRWAKNAGIKNWAYFTLGLPGETEARIIDTIAFAKTLPLDRAFFQPPTPQIGRNFGISPNRSGTGRLLPQTDIEPALHADAVAYWCERAVWEWTRHARPIWSLLTNFKTWLTSGTRIKVQTNRTQMTQINADFH